MAKAELFYVEHLTVQSELSTKMLQGLAEFAGKLDKCILSQKALDRLPERFRALQDELLEGNPRLKRIEDIHLTQPCDPIPGWLTANGVTLLTISTVRSIVLSLEECLQIVSNNKQVS